ncbi:MAG: peptide chain release factor N(5)-glutamine methyltransferase [Thiomonas sp.]
MKQQPVPAPDLPTLAQWLDASGLPRLDAQVLLHSVLGLNRAQQLAHPQRRLDAQAVARLDALAARLRAGEPLAYVTGEREFYGLSFQVTPAVLIPRPETELLVDLALQRLDALPPSAVRRLLDLGTGSGAIAVAVAQARPQVQVWAVDASTQALRVARGNAARLVDAGRPGGPIRFVVSDWFGGLDDAAPRFDCIVSNPPYVAQHDPHLDALRHEPALALVGRQPSADGLGDIGRIVSAAPRFLLPHGWLLLEHGYDQAAAVRRQMLALGYGGIVSTRDLAGIERVTAGQCPQPPEFAADSKIA